jgi:hypothetical protein
MPTELTMIRLDPATRYLAEQLADRYTTTMAAAIRQAIRRQASAEGIEAPPELAGPNPYRRQRQSPESSR